MQSVYNNTDEFNNDNLDLTNYYYFKNILMTKTLIE